MNSLTSLINEASQRGIPTPRIDFSDVEQVVYPIIRAMGREVSGEETIIEIDIFPDYVLFTTEYGHGEMDDHRVAHSILLAEDPVKEARRQCIVQGIEMNNKCIVGYEKDIVFRKERIEELSQDYFTLTGETYKGATE